MVYLIYGSEDFIIQKHISALVKKNNIDSKTLIKMNLEEDELTTAIHKTDTIDLFANTNFVVADNFNKFVSKKRVNKELQMEELNKFVQKQNDNILVLISNDDKFKENTLLKLIEKHGKVIECKKLTAGETKKLMFKAFANRNININPHDVEYIYNKVGKNIRGLISEIEKLSLLDSKITKEVLDKILVTKTEDNIFSLVDSIMNKDLETSMSKYEDLIKSGVAPLTILALIGNEISLMTNIKLASEWNIHYSKLSTVFKKPGFVVSKANKRASKYKENDLIKIMNKISDLDFAFKTGKNTQNVLIQLFFIGLIKGV